MSEWWARFLDGVTAFRKGAAGDEKPETMVRKWAWAQTYIAPTLALLEQGLGAGELRVLLDEGKRRLKPRHLSMLSSWEKSYRRGELCLN
jgi:hypothetical protein